MFAFSFVQSPTHLDTVQSIFRGLSSSGHICWVKHWWYLDLVEMSRLSENVQP